MSHPCSPVTGLALSPVWGPSASMEPECLGASLGLLQIPQWSESVGIQLEQVSPHTGMPPSSYSRHSGRKGQVWLPPQSTGAHPSFTVLNVLICILSRDFGSHSEKPFVSCMQGPHLLHSISSFIPSPSSSVTDG